MFNNNIVAVDLLTAPTISEGATTLENLHITVTPITSVIVNDKTQPGGYQTITLGDESNAFNFTNEFITIVNTKYDADPDADNTTTVDDPENDTYAYGAINVDTFKPEDAAESSDETTIYATSSIAGQVINTKLSQEKGNDSDLIIDVQDFAKSQTGNLIFAASAPGKAGNNILFQVSPLNKFSKYGFDDPKLVDELLIRLNNLAESSEPNPDVTDVANFVTENNIVAPFIVTLTAIEVVGSSRNQMFQIVGSFDDSLVSPIDGSNISLRGQLTNRQIVVEGTVPTLEQMLKWIVTRMKNSSTAYAFTSDGTENGLPIVINNGGNRIYTGTGWVIEPNSVNAVFTKTTPPTIVLSESGDYKLRQFVMDEETYSLLYNFDTGNYDYGVYDSNDDKQPVYPVGKETANFINVSNGTALRIGQTIILDSTSDNGYFNKVVYEKRKRKPAQLLTDYALQFKIDGGNTKVMSNLTDGWNFLTDKKKYPARVALLPTANNGTKLNATGTLLAKRQDVLFVTQTGSLMQTQTQDPETIIDSESYAYNNSFIASAIDWIKYTAPNGNNIFAPACLNIIAAISRLLRNNLWYRAPAGELNGAVLGQGILKLTPEQLGDLYNASLNPIYGAYIWGQKTLERTNTVVSRITGRMTVNEAKRIIEVNMQPYLFNARNDERTRSRVVNELTVAFTPMISVGAAQVEVICNETLNTPDVIDNQTLVLVVKLTVINPIEYVDATVVALTVKAGQTLEIEEVLG